MRNGGPLKLLVFSRDDELITKALKALHDEVVSVSTKPATWTDLLYNPDTDELKDVLAKLPRSFRPDAIVLLNLDYGNFLWGLETAGIPVIAPISDSNLCFDVFRNAAPFVDLFVCNEEKQRDEICSLGAQAVHLPWFGLDPDIFYPQG